jgi:hypothetical protein
MARIRPLRGRDGQGASLERRRRDRRAEVRSDQPARPRWPRRAVVLRPRTPRTMNGRASSEPKVALSSPRK